MADATGAGVGRRKKRCQIRPQKKLEKNLSTHSLTSPDAPITLQTYPFWGPYPAPCALVYGGLLARWRVLLLGTSFGLPDPLLDIPLLKARRLIHGFLLIPQPGHLRLLLPQAGIGSHDRALLAVFVPGVGDFPAGSACPGAEQHWWREPRRIGFAGRDVCDGKRLGPWRDPHGWWWWWQWKPPQRPVGQAASAAHRSA